jgi:hypothetical protein
MPIGSPRSIQYMTVKDATKTKKMGLIVHTIRRMYAPGTPVKDLVSHAHKFIEKYKDQP